MRTDYEELTVFRSAYRITDHRALYILQSRHQIPKIVCSPSVNDRDGVIKGKAARTFQEPFLPLTAMSSHFVGTGFTTAQVVVSLAKICLIYGIYKISAFIYDKATSPIRDIPGPPNPSFLHGNFKELSVAVSPKKPIPFHNDYSFMDAFQKERFKFF